MRTSRGLMLGAVLAAGAGCKPTLIPCEPRTVQLTLSASDRLNPDDQGRSLPTAVVLLQLKDLSRLENASFPELWRDPTSALRDDLLHLEELTLSLAGRETRAFTPKPGATHLAVAALVRKPAGTAWRLVQRLASGPAPMCPEKEPRLRPLELSIRVVEFEVQSAGPAPAPAAGRPAR
jgi:type VI secretion system protein VasD